MVTKEEYHRNIEDALDFLSGNDKRLVADLKSKMEEAAENLEFEEAARYRDLLDSVKRIDEKQKVSLG